MYLLKHSICNAGLDDICEQFWPSSGQPKYTLGPYGICAIKSPSGDLGLVVTSPHPSHAHIAMKSGRGSSLSLDPRCCLAMCLARALIVNTEGNRFNPVLDIKGLEIIDAYGALSREW